MMERQRTEARASERGLSTAQEELPASERHRIEAEIREVLASESQPALLSNKLFSPEGLFSRLARTQEERRLLVKSTLFKQAQDRLRMLERGELTAGDDRALQQYAVLMQYLAYENSVFWSRSGFMLLAQSVFLGFLVSWLPSLSPTPGWQQVVVSIGMGCMGIALCAIWLFVIRAGERWTDRWSRLLSELEARAFGNLDVLRGVAKPDQSHGTPGVRAAASWVAWLFLVAWLAVLAYSIVLAATRMS